MYFGVGFGYVRRTSPLTGIHAVERREVGGMLFALYLEMRDALLD